MLHVIYGTTEELEVVDQAPFLGFMEGVYFPTPRQLRYLAKSTVYLAICSKEMPNVLE